MTSVLPAWKLELIEKKRKKEQDERQKLEEERSRKVSIPEWKKNLLEKKKESASDSPETREQALSVNSVFGPRILRKTSEKTLAIANASQRPVTKVGNDEITKRKVLGDNTVRNHGSALYSSPAPDSNSCVTKAVGIPTEEQHKSNKLDFLQREVGYYRESPQRSDGTLSKEDNFSVTMDVQSTKTKIDKEHVRAPSVISFRRMFEQSKPESNKDISESWIVKSSESLKDDAKSDKRTTESKLVTANDESRLQILNKSARDNAQSIHLESTSLHASEKNQRKIVSPSPSVTPKPYKSFVTTPPWLKNTKLKAVTFLTDERKSVQETMVAKVNSEVENASKDFKSDQKSTAIVESDVHEKERKTLNHSDLVNIPTSTSEAFRGKPVDLGTKKRDLQSLQDQTLQKYSIVTQSDVKEELIAVKSDNENRNQKYLVISSRNQQEPTSLNEKAVTVISTDSVSQVSNELILHKDNQEGNSSHQSSIESLRSMFGPSVGLRRRTSSEDNLFLNANQSELIEHSSVLRRPGQNKRQPAMVRWSADVLSLMSHLIDDDDGDLPMLSPRSDSMIPSANSSQAKRPPPPKKRWTADVLSVMPQPVDNDTSNLSPRNDCNKRSSPSNSLDRARSLSLSDIREEQGIDYFQHKPNVSHGIEHRMHKLIRKASISDISINVEGEDSDSESSNESVGLNDVEFNSKEVPNAQGALTEEIIENHTFIHVDTTVKRNDSQSPVFAQEQEVQPVFARKHSISHDIEYRVTELFHRQLSQQSDGGESEGEKSWESDGNVSNDLVVEKVQEAVPEKPKTEPATVVSIEKSIDFVLPSTKDEPNEDSDHVAADLETKPSKGSVHKLSALFGSSIWKPNKKDKSIREEKPKEKANVGSKPQKISSTEKSNIKESVAKKEDGKKSNLFGKSQKTEEKAEKRRGEKEPSNASIFPWLKKCDKEEEKTEANKTMGVDNKNQRNSSSSSTDDVADTVSFAAHGLRPVRKAEKVEQRLVGKLTIISNASHDKTPAKGVYHKTKASFQLSEQEKDKRSSQKMHDIKLADFERNEAQIPAIVTQHWNGNLKSPESEKSMNESVPITSIDEVPVSSIDMPESGDNDITVIDVPASPDVRNAEKFVFLNGNTEEAIQASNDVSVSVIDLPSPVAKEDVSDTFQGGYLDADELSDGSDIDEVEGSYDFATGEVTHLVNGDIASDDDEDEEDDEDYDEDDEDVPISYIGSAPRYPVPQVVFDSEPIQLKSCLSPKVERKKMKRGKVSFKASHTIHDYPSEETVTAVYDEVKTNNNMPLKTLQNYQPAALVNMEKKLGHTGGKPPVQVTQPVSNGDRRVHDMASNASHPEIKYADEGQGFTDSTDYASALLF